MPRLHILSSTTLAATPDGRAPYTGPAPADTILHTTAHAHYLTTCPPGAIPLNFRDLPTPASPTLLRALALYPFLVTDRYHPRTGQPTTLTTDHGTLARRDPAGHLVYPRQDLVVITLVTDGSPNDRALLINNLTWDPRLLSPLSGYVDLGEPLETAARREVHEETGLTIDPPRYITSAPWPSPPMLTAGFRATLTPGTPTTITPQTDELRDARWITRSELRARWDSGQTLPPPAGSVGRLLIDQWMAGE